MTDTPRVGAKDNQHKIMPYAPYRWSPQFSDYDNLTGFRYNDLGSQTYYRDGFGYLEGQDGVDYEYVIRMNSLSSGQFNFTMSVTNLSAMTTNSFTFTLDLLSHVSLGEKLAIGSNLIFYGQGADITFTYSIE